MLTDNPIVPLILIVEDDNSHALLIQRSFEDVSDEYRLERVGTIRAAKAAMEQHPPALVLSDYQLPDGDGSEMVTLAAGACPVIMMTSHGNEQIAVEAMKIGAQDYIVKSAETFEALPRTMAQALKVWSLIQSRLLALETIEKSEQRFRSFVENANDVLFTLTPTGVFTYISPQWHDFTGYELSETIGQPFLPFVHADDIAGCLEFLQKVIESGERQSGIEFRVLIKDGTYQWYTVNASRSKDPDTGMDILVGIGRDITAQKRAEEEKAKLESQLQQAQKMESVGRLAGGVAHDFNNMLSVILGHAELGLMHLDPTHPVCVDLKEISKTAERSADLTRQLLAFARKQTVMPKIIDLNESVTSMLKMLQRLIGEDIHLTWQPSPDQCQIKMDPSQIDQILANLCVNARDAIEDTGRITIETGTCSIDADYCAANAEATPGDYVRLVVSDDGNGMDRETIAHIFEPFYTTKELGKGTGLGLATVYGAVKQNNGFINIYSEPGKGTTFSIYLPRNDAQLLRKQAEAAVQTVSRGQETILLVEDEAAILHITSLMLEKQGYTVLKANTPGRAIELAREHPGEIHMLMTDVIMPEMNGRDLAKNILTIHPGMKRLFMSGYTADVIAHHGVLDEGVHFIQKPFSLQNMAAMVREVLDKP